MDRVDSGSGVRHPHVEQKIVGIVLGVANVDDPKAVVEHTRVEHLVLGIVLASAAVLGDEVLVHGSIEGPVADVRIRAEDEALLADGERDRARVTLRLPPEERPKPGSRLRVAIAQHTVRMFDPTTGLAIRPR